MNRIFELAITVSTPLMLSGFLSVAFFLILQQIVRKKIFSRLNQFLSGEILKIIIDRLFILSLLALIFGFFGFVIQVLINDIDKKRETVEGHVNNKDVFEAKNINFKPEYTFNTVNFNDEFIKIFKNIILNIEKTEYRGDFFDYWPDGGMRTIIDHIRSLLTLNDIKIIYGGKIFISGPHNEKINYNSNKSYGQYNPDFVKWLDKHVTKIISDKKFVKKTININNKYFRNQFRVYYACYMKLKSMNYFYDMLSEKFKKKLETDGIPDEHVIRLSGFLEPDEYSLHFGNSSAIKLHQYPFLNEVKSTNLDGSALAFWVRRHSDGTDTLFFNILDKWINVYDSKWQKKVHFKSENDMYIDCTLRGIDKLTDCFSVEKDILNNGYENFN